MSGAETGRVLHLGLGAFARAHTLCYTAGAATDPAAGWRVSGFTGTSPRVAAELTAQDCRYHLLVRGPESDELQQIDVLESAHAADDVRAWCRLAADPATTVLTLTVTEKAYLLGADGRPRTEDPALLADLAVLRRDHTAVVRTVPARLAQAVLVREDAGTETPLTVLSCDNLPDNGQVVQQWLTTLLADLAPASAAERQARIGVAGTMVDRITPATTPADLELVAARTGTQDRAAVVTEPFSEWVVQDSFAGARPAWERAGAQLEPDVRPWEQRKLLLLNGAHLLLAHHGALRGRRTTAEAWADPAIATLVEQWWQEAGRPLPPEVAETAAYLTALRARFGNQRIEHRVSQIATDGSLKMAVRVPPVLRHALAHGAPVDGAAASVAGWVRCWREGTADWPDPDADTLTTAARGPAAQAAATMLARLDPALADSRDLVRTVADQLRPVP